MHKWPFAVVKNIPDFKTIIMPFDFVIWSEANPQIFMRVATS